jgi:hypothetical protein
VLAIARGADGLHKQSLGCIWEFSRGGMSKKRRR